MNPNLKNHKNGLRKQFLCAASVFSIVIACDAHSAQLEEVIVTAQKRTESIQDVPLSINSVSADAMSKNGISNLEDMSTLVPNLNISAGPNANTIVMRGLGSGPGNPSFEQSVGLYVDGIYAGRAAQFQIPFLDVQRVEVLRGPQGVLFGKNSIAGAISIHSQKPEEEFNAEIQTSYEVNYSTRSLTSIISGPLTDTFGARLVATTKKENPYMENNYSGDSPGESDGSTINSQAVRLSLDWAITDSTDVFLKIEDGDFEEKGTNFQILSYDRTAPIPTATAQFTNAIVAAQDAAGEDYQFNDKNYQDGGGEGSTIAQSASSLTLNAVQRVGDFEITYIGGVSNYDRAYFSDVDFSASDLIVIDRPESFKQTSHEFRFSSDAGERFQYMAGLYYLDRELDLRNSRIDFDLQTQVTVPVLNQTIDANFAIAADYVEITEGYSGFFQGTWNITDTISATLGLRRSLEEKSSQAKSVIAEPGTRERSDPATEAFVAASVNANAYDYGTQTRKEANTDGTFNFQWVVNDDINLYFTHARATKGGGYNASEISGDITAFEFEPERARNFEIGAKTELFDRRLRLNTSIFYTKFAELQLSAFDGVAFRTENAGTAVTKGIETELTYVASDEILVGVNAAILRARYTEFQGACPQNENAQSQECKDNDGDSQSYRGKPLVNAPDTSGSMYIDYSKPVNSILFNARVDAKYSDDFFYMSDNDPNGLQEAYWKFNANIGITNLDNTWGVSLSVLNITDERTTDFGGQSLLVPGSYWGNTGAPRMYTLNLRYALER